MITLPKYHGETAVFGLGRSGLSVVRALAAAGNRVSAWDQNGDRRAAAEKAGAEIRDLETAFGAPARLVLSPGVPLTHPQPHAVVKAARAADVLVLGDVELFADAVRNMAEKPKIVAVTGTNGKSTTSALIAHLLATRGAAVRLGGNIGHAVLDLDMPAQDTQTVYVLELSSYQIDLLETLGPDVAVLTNLSPDHLDRHGDMPDMSRPNVGFSTCWGPMPPPLSAVTMMKAAPLPMLCTLRARKLAALRPPPRRISAGAMAR